MCCFLHYDIYIQCETDRWRNASLRRSISHKLFSHTCQPHNCYQDIVSMSSTLSTHALPRSFPSQSCPSSISLSLILMTKIMCTGKKLHVCIQCTCTLLHKTYITVHGTWQQGCTTSTGSHHTCTKWTHCPHTTTTDTLIVLYKCPSMYLGLRSLCRHIFWNTRDSCASRINQKSVARLQTASSAVHVRILHVYSSECTASYANAYFLQLWDTDEIATSAYTFSATSMCMERSEPSSLPSILLSTSDSERESTSRPTILDNLHYPRLSEVTQKCIHILCEK